MFTPGQLAYTRYAFFEWSLILFDILYDSVATLDLEDSGIEVSTVYQSPFMRFSLVRGAQTSFSIMVNYRIGRDATGQNEMYNLHPHLA